jgi:hypothetical protein
MQGQRRQLMPSTVRGWIAALSCVAFVSALALSSVPRWHELIHSDANTAQHECAVTFIGAGNYHQPAPAPLVAIPVPVCHFRFIPALHPVWVASPFLGARVFEHAPPARA